MDDTGYSQKRKKKDTQKRKYKNTPPIMWPIEYYRPGYVHSPVYK